MQLPDKQPLTENVVVTSPEELGGDLIREGLSKGSGAFLKIFAKDSAGKYYITVLLDRSKVLAAECLLVDKNQNLSGGDEAISLLKSLLDKPMVVDVYTLDELEIKLSIADNVDVYVKTPKVPIEELFGKTGGEGPPKKEGTESKSPTAVEQGTPQGSAANGGTGEGKNRGCHREETRERERTAPQPEGRRSLLTSPVERYRRGRSSCTPKTS